MGIKSILKGLASVLVFVSLQAFAADSDLDKFCKKYDISQSELTQFQRKYLESDLGLKRLTGLRSQLSDYTSKEIVTDDLVDFAVNFSKKMDQISDTKLTEIGGSYGLDEKAYDKALDNALDDADGKNPSEFLKKISESLMKSAPKLSKEKALSLAKALQIRMDMKMMKNHLKDDAYMRHLLGEKAYDKAPIEKPGKPGVAI